MKSAKLTYPRAQKTKMFYSVICEFSERSRVFTQLLKSDEPYFAFYIRGNFVEQVSTLCFVQDSVQSHQ